MNTGKHILYAIIILLLGTFSLYSLVAAFVPETAKAKQVAPSAPDPWITEIIPEGGSIYSILSKQPLDGKQTAIISYRMGEYIDVSTIQPGDTLKIKLNDNKKQIQEMLFIQEPTIRHHFSVVADSLIYSMQQLPVKVQRRIIAGTMQNTLDATLLAMGLSPKDKQAINNGLEGEINFQRDARNGDQFKVFVEERVFEGKVLPGRTILYAMYSGERTGTKELFRYVDAEENSVLNGLYNLEGKSNSTSGVGFPLGRIHMVSNFGKRLDPFSGRWSNHQGVDYRAGYGTPVYAVANGEVTEARYHGGWGNNIIIKHPSGLSTQYAHLSSIGVRNGQTVRKGQVIGRVGSTGRSTGAHLHFGLMKGRSYINPSNLKMVGAEKLNDQQMAAYKQQISIIRAAMAALATPVAYSSKAGSGKS